MDRNMARFIISVGILLVLVGVVLLLVPRFPWLGRLPGDFRWSRGNFTLSIPIMTCLILSLLLTILMNLLSRR